MTSSSLTSDQQAASDAFFDFLMGDAKTFVLSGGAGVGKTYLMSHICQNVMSEYADACKLIGQTQIYTTVTFTATTNKAAEVLEQSVNVPVQTIHSFLGLKVRENYKTGKTLLEKTNNWRVRHNQIVFIDESSMIDQNLYNIILESFQNSKIVFVGDHAQMSPVNEDISPIYLDVDQDNFVFLGKPIRNAGSPPLVDLCKQLRDTVETGVFRPIESVPGTIDYLSPDEMQAKITEVFGSSMNPSCRILCFTNDRVKDYNAFIRDLRSLPPTPIEGDILVSANTYSRGATTLNVEREVEVLHVSTSMQSLGQEHLFADGRPIMTRDMDVLVKGLGQMTVTVADEPERLRAAIQHYAKKKAWAEYFDLKNACADLRDKAACTVYKSQGSTYESVFVDLGNIGSSFDAVQVARMLFVAISRATTRVYLYGRLPYRYHNTKEKAA